MSLIKHLKDLKSRHAKYYCPNGVKKTVSLKISENTDFSPHWETGIEMKFSENRRGKDQDGLPRRKALCFGQGPFLFRIIRYFNTSFVYDIEYISLGM